MRLCSLALMSQMGLLYQPFGIDEAEMLGQEPAANATSSTSKPTWSFPR
jgi:hypothetical protein